MTESEQSCFHCGLPVETGVEIHVDIEGQAQPMCCYGCAAVAKAIVGSGLSNFYTHRTVSSRTGQPVVPDFLQKISTYDLPEVQKQFVTHSTDNLSEASLIIEGIVCAACVWMSEKHIAQLPGVISVQINYSTRRAQVVWDAGLIKLSDIIAAISHIGYMAHPYDSAKWQDLIEKERKTQLKRLSLAGLFGMQVMMLAVALYAGDYQDMQAAYRQYFYWVSFALTLPIILYSAKPFFQSAWRDLRQKSLGMDVPVSLGIGVAFLASVWTSITLQGHVYYDSVAMFVFFLLTGRYFELMARKKVVEATESLASDMPVTANRFIAVGSADVESVSVTQLVLGDRVLVKAGETIPADGKILEGDTSVDESLLTGESRAIAKQAGNLVVGGSINITSPIVLLVEKTGADTVLSHIQRMLAKAQVQKPRITQLADHVASWFVVLVLLVASVVAWYWWSAGESDWLAITVSVLIVTCPCALSLATPTAMTAATGSLTRAGLLVAKGSALETLNQVTHVVFDKTGTLTCGKLSISSVAIQAAYDESFCLRLAAGLEIRSEHYLAKPFAAIAQPLCIEQLQNFPGQGVSGRYQGQRVAIGTQAFVCATQLPEDAANQCDGTPLYLAIDGQLIATFCLVDELRHGAVELIQGLQGKSLILLSGDHPAAVANIANTLGIEQALSRQSPADKLAFVQQLQAQGAVVAMLGDGVNDAPVLSAANVSIAMGSGTQLAQASADIVLLSDSLVAVVYGFHAAAKTLRIIRQNLLWALAYNVLALPLAAAGYIAPWMAAIGMSLSSIIVVLNALRLSRLPSCNDRFA